MPSVPLQETVKKGNRANHAEPRRGDRSPGTKKGMRYQKPVREFLFFMQIYLVEIAFGHVMGYDSKEEIFFFRFFKRGVRFKEYPQDTGLCGSTGYTKDMNSWHQKNESAD